MMELADAGLFGGAVALALGLVKVIELLVQGLLGRRNGNNNGKMCLLLEQLAAGQREVLTEQRTTNEIPRETRRDHERMSEQLARIEQEAGQVSQR